MSLKDQIEKAIDAHGQWKDRLVSAIDSGSSTFEPAKVSVDNACDFGKWLYSLGAGEKAANFDEIRDLHAQFHAMAGKVLHLATSGGKAEAEAIMSGDFKALSGKLVDTLKAWEGQLASA